MNITFAPGPSQPYPKIKSFITEALASDILSMSHRSEKYAALQGSLDSSLRELMSIPAEYHIWFLGSGTEGMERIIENTVKKHSHHFINGAFSQKFAQIASQLGRRTTETKANWHEAFDLSSEVVPDEAELIAVTVNETSTGVSIRSEDIAALRSRYPDKLLAVDVVSAVPQIEVDFRQIDMAFFSVQKGFGLPAGLGVMVVSPRALARSKHLDSEGQITGSYHSFMELAKSSASYNTPETPNVLGLYLLKRVSEDLLERGPDTWRSVLNEHAASLYRALDNHPVLTPAVKDGRLRSPSVIVAEAPKQAELFEHLNTAGLSVGKGYKDEKTSHIRIANFPAHIEYMDRLISALKDF